MKASVSQDQGPTSQIEGHIGLLAVYMTVRIIKHRCSNSSAARAHHYSYAGEGRQNVSGTIIDRLASLQA